MKASKNKIPMAMQKSHLSKIKESQNSKRKPKKKKKKGVYAAPLSLASSGEMSASEEASGSYTHEKSRSGYLASI